MVNIYNTNLILIQTRPAGGWCMEEGGRWSASTAAAVILGGVRRRACSSHPGGVHRACHSHPGGVQHFRCHRHWFR